MKSKSLKPAILILIIVFNFTGCKKDEPNIVYNKKYVETIKKVRNEFILYLSSNSIPGGSIAVSKGGEIIYSEGLGLASKDLEVPVNRETKFRIGQVTEIFTSLAYHLLVKNGTLHPDSSIQSYLPDFPEKKYKITLRNLANHSSGIRSEHGSESIQTNLNVNIMEGLESFKHDDLLFQTGYFQNISPLNYNLLGAVMENATGKKFNHLINNLVIDTLHLENTVFDNPLMTINGRSNFYDFNHIAMLTNSITIDLRSKAPSQGLLSTAEDLVKFGNAFLYSDYISEDIKSKIFTLPELKSGVLAGISDGWTPLHDRKNRTIYSRTGHVNGGGASIIIFPEEEIVVAVAVNATIDMSNPTLYNIASYFLPTTEKQEQSDTEHSDSAAK